jgi:outer membrane protein OmpA-like peptidoglycan-associated protein
MSHVRGTLATRFGGLMTGALALSVTLWARGAAAEEVALGLVPAPVGDPGFAVQRASVRGHLAPRARVLVDYAHRPLVSWAADQHLEVQVPWLLKLHAQVGVALAHRFAIGVEVPTALGEATRGLGDLRLTGRAVLFERRDEDAARGVALGLATAVSLGTGTTSTTTDGALTTASSLVADGVRGDMRWAMNAGVRERPQRLVRGLVPTHVGSAFTLGGSIAVTPGRSRALAVGLEVALESPFAGGARLFDPQSMVGQALLFAHQRFGNSPFELGVAAGPGVARRAGAAEVRALGFIGYSPESVPPPPDADGDEVIDVMDACPRVPGEASRVAATNGCPEMLDRDGDAVPDAFDACPREAGVTTSVAETHGCPSVLDRDEDGVPDDFDACPERVGEPDRDGCPAMASPGVRLARHRIELDEPVRFATDTATLDPRSLAILEALARLLDEHPELLRVEIQGHTDDTGSDAHNDALSIARAEAVAQALVERGVSRGRLVPRGFGKRRPVDARGTAGARARNRRVELHVVERRGRGEAR